MPPSLLLLYLATDFFLQLAGGTAGARIDSKAIVDPSKGPITLHQGLEGALEQQESVEVEQSLTLPLAFQ